MCACTWRLSSRLLLLLQRFLLRHAGFITAYSTNPSANVRIISVGTRPSAGSLGIKKQHPAHPSCRCCIANPWTCRMWMHNSRCCHLLNGMISAMLHSTNTHVSSCRLLSQTRL